MAKNRNRNQRDRSPQFSPFSNRLRDDFSIASDPDRTFEPVSRSLHAPDQLDRVLEYLEAPAVRSQLSELEDRRTYRAGDEVPAQNSSRAVAKTKLDLGQVRQVLAFAHPRSVLVCVRRKIRDEVLHALGKTGKGSGRPRRFNSNSRIKC